MAALRKESVCVVAARRQSRASQDTQAAGPAPRFGPAAARAEQQVAACRHSHSSQPVARHPPNVTDSDAAGSRNSRRSAAAREDATPLLVLQLLPSSAGAAAAHRRLPSSASIVWLPRCWSQGEESKGRRSHAENEAAPPLARSERSELQQHAILLISHQHKCY
jgi:hypothetical protein